MGVCISKQTSTKCCNVPVSKQNTDDQLQPTTRRQVKLLLLGPGESGKSTIFRQLRLIYSNGFSATERMGFVPLIRRHCVENFADLLAGADKLKLLTDEDRVVFEEVLRVVDATGLRAADVCQLQAAWTSQPLQQAFQLRSRFQLADWAHHFFDQLPRIAQSDYVPTDEDILRCRIRTAGFSEINFVADDIDYRVVDVGGQRSERRKWIHCFEGVQAVIFVAAISEFDQTIFEDNRTNRFTETLRLFHEICNTRFFVDTPIILFLNKKDLLKEKLAQTPLEQFFPEYTGGDDLQSAIDFLAAKFTLISTSPRALYTHVTCAVNTRDVNFVFASVRDSIVSDSLHSAGLV